MVPARTGSNKPATANERELKYTAFASNIEIKLNVAIVTNLICIPTTAGHRCTEAEAMKFMMLCQARKLNPFEGDCFLQGYDSNKGPVFSLITAHQAFLKRAEVNDQYDGMESGVLVIDKNTGEDKELVGDYFHKEHYELVGGWARVHCKNRKFPMHKRLDLDAFRKPYGRWKDDPAGMIVKCAEADALRSAFPTMLGNLYLEQELDLQEKNVTPAAPSIPPSLLPTPTGGTNPPPPATNPAPSETPTPPAATEPPKPETPPPAVTDKTEGMSAEQVATELKRLMAQDNVSEDQVLAHCKEQKIAKHHTEVWQLADSKLRLLVNEWDARKADIQSITI